MARSISSSSRTASIAFMPRAQAGSPKMMSIGLHCRLVGQPGRVMGLKRFVDYIKSHDKVWVAHPHRHRPPLGQRTPLPGPRIHPLPAGQTRFRRTFGSIFEHSPWIAERAWEGELAPANDTAIGLHFALRTQFRLATDEERLARAPRPSRPRRQARRRQAADRRLDRGTGLGRPRCPDRRRARPVHRSSTPPMSPSSASPSSSRSRTTPRPRSSPPSKPASATAPKPNSPPPARKSNASLCCGSRRCCRARLC